MLLRLNFEILNLFDFTPFSKRSNIWTLAKEYSCWYHAFIFWYMNVKNLICFSALLPLLYFKREHKNMLPAMCQGLSVGMQKINNLQNIAYQSNTLCVHSHDSHVYSGSHIGLKKISFYCWLKLECAMISNSHNSQNHITSKA